MTIYLQAFCGNEITRAYLMQPFSRGDWSYACDGRIAIRVPRREEVPVDEDNSAAVEKIFTDRPLAALRPFRGADIPDVKPEEIVCRDCNGRGHKHDCPDCECECEGCNGSGKNELREPLSVDIGGVPFAARYVRLFKKLPALRVPEIVLPKMPMRFAFDGGEGILMPMHDPHETHIKETA